jgi:UDP-3-O-[3-hydroxymyristoyl] glucosamine N-acyltransferase
MQKTLEQIAQIIKGELAGDPKKIISGVGPIDQADSHQIAFAEKGKSLKQVAYTTAGAVVVPDGVHNDSKNLIRVANPRLSFAKLMAIFHPPALPEKGIHASAVIGEYCTLGQDIAISAGVVIGQHVTLGDRVVLYPNVVLGDYVTIGPDTVIYPNVSILERCRVGCRVIVHAGSVIGSDGFGFVPDHEGRFVKIPQTGIVQIDDDVEIGANNAIDRGTFGRTWIQAGVKTDNLVHIAHNVTIGKHCAIAGQVGFAGSTTLGSHVVIAGQAGIGGHLEIADGVTIGPQAAVAQSVDTRQVISGTTLAMPHNTWLRLQRILPELPELQKNVRHLRQQIERLKEKIK